MKGQVPNPQPGAAPVASPPAARQPVGTSGYGADDWAEKAKAGQDGLGATLGDQSALFGTGAWGTKRVVAQRPLQMPSDGLVAGADEDRYNQALAPIEDKKIGGTVDELLVAYHKQTKDELAVLQDKMFDAGLYGSMKREDIRFSRFDDATFDAYKSLLVSTARQIEAGVDVTIGEVLDQAIPTAEEKAAKEAKDGLNEQGSADIINLTDPAALAAVVRKAAQDIIGEGLSEAQISGFVTRFQELQRRDQSAGFDLQDSKTDGTLTQPDVSSQADSYVREIEPDKASSSSVANYFNTAMSVLGMGG